MASSKCLARLTSWERTNSPIGDSNKRASIVKLCKNVPRTGLLCDDCSGRPHDGKYQTKMCHGLLTEAPCESSHLYGSSWYWERVAKHGEPHDKGWLETAQEAQEAAEAVCLAAGYEPWRVQRPSEGGLEEMRVKKAKADKAAAAKRMASVQQQEQRQQVLTKFVVPIKVLYEESAKPPETLPTDTCEIWQEEVDGAKIWVTENGLVFACCDTTGEPAELLGRRKGDDFIPLG
jgi:hypothetical protein